MHFRSRTLAVYLLACAPAVVCSQEVAFWPFPNKQKTEAPAVPTKGKVQFTGLQAISEADLRTAEAEELGDIQNNGVSPARADDLSYYVGSYYRKQGYAKVEVTYEIQGGTVIVKVVEGPKSVLHHLTFTGNRVVDNKTLYDFMIGATPETLAREPAKFPYTTDQISAGIDRVRGLYLSKGYLNVTIDSPGVQLSKDGTQADVTIHITEGPAFTVGAVTFTGDTLFPREKLIAALGESTNGPFAPGTAESMQRNLQSFYKGQGHYGAEVTATANPTEVKSGPVPIEFAITPKPLFRFGGLTVRNETPKPRLRQDFLYKRLANLHGQVYDPKKIDDVYRDMLKTGLFDNFRISLQPAPGNELTMDLTTTEAKSKEIGFTFGYGSYEGVTGGIRLGDRDFLGYGRPVTISADYSERGLSAEVLYVDPWFLDSPYALRARLYSEARTEIGYDKNDVGLRVDFTRKVLPHLELGVFGEAAVFNVTGTGIDQDLLGPTSYTRVTAGLTQNSDFRNDPLNPNRGFVFNSSFDYTEVESGTGFTRSIGRFSYYLPLGKTILAFGARAGYISANADEVPIDSRFFNGGENTVRSFAERELGPKSHGNPIGGTLYTVFNIEYDFPIAGALDGAVFVDAGSLKSIDDPEASQMRYGIGVGVRYKLPTGPVRLDLGINPDPNRRTDEKIGAINFSFGFAF